MTSQINNRHVVIYTVTELDTGRAYEIQDDREIVGDLAAAQAALAARSTGAGQVRQSQDGFNRSITHTNHRLHSWHVTEAPLSDQWNVDPLGRILHANGGRW